MSEWHVYGIIGVCKPKEPLCRQIWIRVGKALGYLNDLLRTIYHINVQCLS